MYKRRKGRTAAYNKLNGHDTMQCDVNRKPRISKSLNTDVAELVHHAKGLGRIKIAYARKIAKARNDDFYNGLRVLSGV